jgi:anti-sigma factor RsiW
MAASNLPETIQRYHDGEATRAEAAWVEDMLAGQPELRIESTRLEHLHARLRTLAAQSRPDSTVVDALIVRVMAKLPERSPSRQAHVRMNHVLISIVVLICVVFGCGLTEQMRSFIPVEGIALTSALIGFCLVIAARPLANLEAAVFAKFLRRRIAVGDGEVLVCRVCGLALIVGGSHIIGWWG